MRNENPEFRIFQKEWRGRLGTVAALGGVMLLLAAYMLGSERPNTFPLAAFSAVAFAVLGVRLVPREESDPARSFIYQLPISRRRLLAVKLAALATQAGVLMLVSLAVAGLIFLSDAPRFISNHQATQYQFSFFILVLAAGAAPALALLAAIVSLHVRSAIVALVLTLVFAALLGGLLAKPQLLGNQSGRLMVENLGWVVLNFNIAAALLAAWLFFLFCRTRVQELSPTPRSLLVFVFALGAFEVFYTFFYTGWRDLAYLVLGW